MADSPFDSVLLRELLGQIRSGDRAAQQQLILKIATRLEHLIRRMRASFPIVRRMTDTDDILQNALMRLMRSLQELQPKSTREFFGLAAEHVRRELLDLSRRYSRHRRQRDLTTGNVLPKQEVHPSHTSDVADELHDINEWCALHEEIERLPEDDREIVNSIFYDGLSPNQVAEVLNVSARTIQRRWASTIAKLKQALKLRGYGA